MNANTLLAKASFFGRSCLHRIHWPSNVRCLSTPSASKPQPDASWPIRPHINFKGIRERVEEARLNVKQRGMSKVVDVDRVLSMYEQVSSLKRDVDVLRRRRNESSDLLKTTGSKLSAEEKKKIVEEGRALKEQLSSLESQLSSLEETLTEEGKRVPNFSHPSVPIGPESNAKIVRLVGDKPNFSFTPKDHVEIAERLDLVDFEAASLASGHKFYYLKNEGALLELALVNWAVSKMTSHGYTPVLTPDLVRRSLVEGCGFQPRGESTQIYSVANTDLCLAGTAEIPLAGMYAGQLLPQSKLPTRLVGFSHCFRTEIGAAGLSTRGLYRVHQFSKVEIFAFSEPEKSEDLLQEIATIQQDMFSELGLHFKVLDMPTEELGAPASRKYDIEAWMPGKGIYGEISSTSNCTDYQSRLLNIRYKAESASSAGATAPVTVENRFVHTLNGTACAVPRMIIAILETFQQEDGSVIIPPVLRPFMGGRERISPKK